MWDDFLVFLLAEMDIRTGWTMVCTKWRIAVRRRHKFLQICWNLFSLSIPETLGQFMIGLEQRSLVVFSYYR